MGLREALQDLPLERRLSYDPESETFFVNFEGYSVRGLEEIERIRKLVTERLAPVGHKVRAIVNYDNFSILPELLDAYSEAVRWLSDRHDTSAIRYTTNGFLRAKLGDALGRRKLTAHIHETAVAARAHMAAEARPVDHGG